jgi:hypothetical protein
LSIFADARLADRRPIDGRVRPDLDIVFDDDAGTLRNLEMGAVLLLREAEAFAAEDAAVLHDDTVADDDAVADGHLRMDCAVVADTGARTDDDVGIDDGSRSNRRPRSDGHEGADRHTGAEFRVRSNRTARIDSAWRRRGRHQQRHGSRERQIRLIGAQQSRRRGGGRHVESDDDRRRAGGRELRHVLLVREKAQVARRRALDPRDAVDLDFAVAIEPAAEPVSNLAELHGRNGTSR